MSDATGSARRCQIDTIRRGHSVPGTDARVKASSLDAMATPPRRLRRVLLTKEDIMKRTIQTLAMVAWAVVVLHHASSAAAAGTFSPRPRGFAVLAEHGPGEWGEMFVPDGWTFDRAADPLRVSSIVNTIMPPLTDEDRERGFLVFRHHYCDQVLPETAPMPQDLNRTLSLSATPGEYEPVSFCIRSLRIGKSIRLRIHFCSSKMWISSARCAFVC